MAPAAAKTWNGLILRTVRERGSGGKTATRERNDSPLIPLGSLEVNDRRVRLLDAAVWLFPNRPGTADIDPDIPPFRIDLDDGISVVPGRGFPRVPLLGLRPFRLNGLRMNIDGTTQLVSLTAPA
jgi:hypothetical protein